MNAKNAVVRADNNQGKYETLHVDENGNELTDQQYKDAMRKAGVHDVVVETTVVEKVVQTEDGPAVVQEEQKYVVKDESAEPAADGTQAENADATTEVTMIPATE